MSCNRASTNKGSKGSTAAKYAPQQSRDKMTKSCCPHAVCNDWLQYTALIGRQSSNNVVRGSVTLCCRLPGAALHRGDRVVVAFDIACGQCFFCNHGYQSSCDTTNPSKVRCTESLWAVSSSHLLLQARLPRFVHSRTWNTGRTLPRSVSPERKQKVCCE